MLRSRSTLRPCWKCGQQISHYCSWQFQSRKTATGRWIRAEFARGRKFRQKYPLVPVRHLIEKSGHWTICRGSEAPK